MNEIMHIFHKCTQVDEHYQAAWTKLMQKGPCQFSSGGCSGSTKLHVIVHIMELCHES